jgi:hypothetical protein
MSLGTTDELIKIGPEDPRYLAVVGKRFNKRFRARPDYVRLASSTDQVVSAVEEAVRATASAQRGSILDIACTTGWLDPQEEAKNLAWVRSFYGELFAESGGVPVPGEAYDGTFINHPDTDLADPALNTSGVPWHTLYYQASYPRLQRIKAR